MVNLNHLVVLLPVAPVKKIFNALLILCCLLVSSQAFSQVSYDNWTNGSVHRSSDRLYTKVILVRKTEHNENNLSIAKLYGQ